MERISLLFQILLMERLHCQIINNWVISDSPGSVPPLLLLTVLISEVPPLVDFDWSVRKNDIDELGLVPDFN